MLSQGMGKYYETLSFSSTVAQQSDTGKTNAAFWAEMTQSIKDNTEFDQNFIVSSTSTQYNLTASTQITETITTAL